MDCLEVTPCASWTWRRRCCQRLGSEWDVTGSLYYITIYNHLLCHVDDDLHALQRDSKHSAQPSKSGRLLWQCRSLVLAYSWRYLGPQISRIFLHPDPHLSKLFQVYSECFRSSQCFNKHQKTSLLKPQKVNLRPSTGFFDAVVAPAWCL